MAKKKKKLAFSQDGQRTVETTLFEPRLIADRSSVNRIFQAIDAAQVGNTLDLFTLYRDFVLGDSHVQNELNKRKLAVLGDTMSVSPSDSNNQEDKIASDFINEMIPSGIKGWRHSCSSLLDSVLWPVSVMEKVFAVENGRFVIQKLVPVPYHLLDFTLGRMRIRQTDPMGMPLTDFDDPDPNRYIVHRGHLLNMPDNFGGPMRSLLFWILFRTCDRDWWIRFLERFGAPFLVGKYDTGDENTRVLLQQAFSAATKLFGIAVSRDVDIELKEASANNGDAFRIFHEVANSEISKLIVGQTLSSTASPTGMNSGVANLQGDVREDLRQFDAIMLLETIQDQLVNQLLEVNGLDGNVRIMWGSASTSELKSKVVLLKDLKSAGLIPDDAALATISKTVGFNIIRDTSNPNPSVLPMSADAFFFRSKPKN